MQLTLIFEPTLNPDIARVRIEDIWMKFPPVRIPFDIDRDGQLECIDFNALHLGAEVFDLEQSGGEYNLRDGRLTLSICISMVPPGLAFQGTERAPTPVRIVIKEHGWLDLETGYLETHADRWTVPEGALAGLTISNHVPPATVTTNCGLRFGIYLASSYLPNLYATLQDNGIILPDKVWKHPDTEIILAWYAPYADEVIIDPGVGWVSAQPTTKKIQGVDHDMIYLATSKGQYCSGEPTSEVRIKIIIPSNNPNIVGEHDFISDKANFNSRELCWFIHLPIYTYDETCLVNKLIIDSNPGCVSFPAWDVDYTSYDGVPWHINIDAMGAWADAGQFSLPGEYRFKPSARGGDVERAYAQREVPLSFRLWVV